MRQVIHKRCKGTLVVVADVTDALSLACRKCKRVWIISETFTVGMPNDMRQIRDAETLEAGV